MKKRIEFLDTTLRDGNKLPFVVLNIRDRLEIAHQLKLLGVDVIDAGYPTASKEDREGVDLIAREVEGPYISALSRALERDIEKALNAIRASNKPYLHIFLPISTIFLTDILKKSKDETLKTIEHSIHLGKEAGVKVQFSLGEIGEADRAFMLEAARIAAESGVDVLNLADTNGTLYPAAIQEMITQTLNIIDDYPNTLIGVHFHNDLGLATADTLIALESGAGHVEVTLGGIGAKGGNAALEEIVFGLEAFSERLGLSHGIQLDQLYKSSTLVSRITGIQPHPNKPIFGKCAFLEFKGFHARDSLSEKLKTLLQNKTIGRSDDFLLGLGDHEMTMAGFDQQLENLGIPREGINLEKVYHLYQSQAKRKKKIHLSELKAMVYDARNEIKAPYTLVSFNVMTGSNSLPVGIVELRRDETSLVQSASGSGAIDALCQAVDKVVAFKPELVLYTLDCLTEGKDARAEVTVTLNFMGKRFHGHYGSTDVVEASVRAYLDAVNRIELHRLSGAGEEFYIDGEYLWE